MSQVDVVFLNAGKQTRFGGKIPKALSKVQDDKTLFDLNLENFRWFTRIGNIYNATSAEFAEYFSKSDCGNVIVPSGGGTAVALFNFIREAKPKNDLIVCWGDSYYSKDLIKAVLENPKNSFPVKFTKDPYVDFMFNYKGVQKVAFSKNEDFIRPYGFQDLSIFRVNVDEVRAVCFDLLHKKSDEKSDDCNILEAFNITNWKLKPYITSFNVQSFNTQDEWDELRASGSI